MLHLRHEALLGNVVSKDLPQVLDLVIPQVTLIDELSRAFRCHVKHFDPVEKRLKHARAPASIRLSQVVRQPAPFKPDTARIMDFSSGNIDIALLGKDLVIKRFAEIRPELLNNFSRRVDLPAVENEQALECALSLIHI